MPKRALVIHSRPAAFKDLLGVMLRLTKERGWEAGFLLTKGKYVEMLTTKCGETDFPVWHPAALVKEALDAGAGPIGILEKLACKFIPREHTEEEVESILVKRRDELKEEKTTLRKLRLQRAVEMELARRTGKKKGGSGDLRRELKEALKMEVYATVDEEMRLKTEAELSLLRNKLRSRKAAPGKRRSLARVFWSCPMADMQARLILDKLQPSAILLEVDRRLGLEAAILKEANRRGIACILVPFANFLPDGPARYRMLRKDYVQEYSCKPWFNQLVAALHPRWTYTFEGEKMHFSPPVEELIGAAFSHMSPNPWTLGGSGRVHMAVESTFFAEAALAMKVPLERITVTGRPAMDALAATFGDAVTNGSYQIAREGDLEVQEQIALFAVPQMYENKLLDFDTHVSRIREVIQELASIQGLKVLLNFHPKVDLEIYRKIDWGIHAVLTNPTEIERLVPTCNLFVAGFSSTVTYALACRKPVLVLDLYGLGFRFYDSLPNLKRVTATREIAKSAVDLLSVPIDSPADDRNWALLDGKCTERLANLVEELSARHHGQ